MAKAKKEYSDEISVDSFAGFPVKDYSASLAWYERLLGCPPAFLPHDREAVWELAEQRYIFIKVLPEHTWCSMKIPLADASVLPALVLSQQAGNLPTPSRTHATPTARLARTRDTPLVLLVLLCIYQDRPYVS